jgi:hypothetical protein
MTPKTTTTQDPNKARKTELKKSINSLMKNWTVEQMEAFQNFTLSADGMFFASRMVDLFDQPSDKIYWAGRIATWKGHVEQDCERLEKALVSNG